ncbi:MAG: type II toxin-antitoxin system prevent-host-death family antitoxin [Gemmatimonadetes bacterium]|nr:type II toxin-antitoxin system prevent-host-death family antitoxin [Gemmatimonadota bacterium]MBT8404119.1 type II toxin-antitoxin system prevent-host-death family antitoxin [Gemmatimonadota bacterium]NNK62102.1 type II toxin-antitoxin system prevent-host-death family antitoxin [Gemmatimonadota bacterium]
MSERTVSVAALKARLSEYLRTARAGEVVIVTDRGTPVAQLGPLAGSSALAGRLEALSAAGLVRGPGIRLDPGFVRESRPADPTGRSLEAVLEERAEGW